MNGHAVHCHVPVDMTNSGSKPGPDDLCASTAVGPDSSRGGGPDVQRVAIISKPSDLRRAQIFVSYVAGSHSAVTNYLSP